jgi:hypothetical protein
MFEDLKQNVRADVNSPSPAPIQPPVNASQTSQPEPDDMFAEVDKTLTERPASMAPAASKPLVDLGPTRPLTELPRAGMKKGGKKIFYIIGILVIVVVVAGLLYSHFSTGYENLRTVPVDNSTNVPPATTETEDNVSTEELVEEVVEEYLDSDSDGLTDEQELSIGTDPFNPDSDNDGLFDREEVVSYKTDPLNSDSDGDTYLDGSEVKAGYDPSGPGKLLNLPATNAN